MMICLACLRKSQEYCEHMEQVTYMDPLDLFWQELPELLKTKPGKWVVYTTNGLVQEGDDSDAMYKWSFAQGFEVDDFIVEQVVPRE